MGQETQGNVQQLTVGLEPNLTNLLIYVAQSQNYFADNGLNVTIKSYPSGAAAQNAMLSGQVNIASATEFVLARNILSNNSIETIGSISKFTHVYVIANKSRGIQNITDLSGKKVGLTLQTNSEFYFGRFLQLNNIELNKITLVNVPTSQYLNVLKNGTVDAVVAWQPYPATIQNQVGKDNVVTWDVQSGQPGYEPIISTSSWVADHSEVAKKFLASLVEAQDYVTENPSKGQAIAVNSINFTSQYVQTVWPNYLFSVSLEQSLILATQDESQWLISNHLTNATAVPSYGNYVYKDALYSVNPSAVNIID
jgi:NitT/TauT family transport system substrate-binding protein